MVHSDSKWSLAWYIVQYLISSGGLIRLISNHRQVDIIYVFACNLLFNQNTGRYF